VKLSQAIDLFLVSVRADGRKEKTIEYYRQCLTPCCAFLNDTDLESITSNQLREFLASLYARNERWVSHPRVKPKQGGLSLFTIQGYLRALKRFFNFCVAEEYIKPSQNPAARLKRQRIPRTIPKEMSDDDLRAILQESRKSMFPQRDYALILFLAGTGCRVGGLVGLRVGDLDFERRRAVVTEKGDKSRIIPLSEKIVDALREWLAVRRASSDYVFVKRRSGEQMNGDSAALVLTRLAHRANVKGHHNPHSLRHRYAKKYLMNGGDLASLSRLMGHYDISVTSNYYSIFSIEELQEKQEKFSPLRGLV